MNCDRCGHNLPYFKPVDTPNNRLEATIGYYDVRFPFWSGFRMAGESFICDHCMWHNSRYIAIYGENQCSESCCCCKGRSKGLAVLRDLLWKRIEQTVEWQSGEQVIKLLQDVSEQVWQAGIDDIYDSLVGKVSTAELSGLFDIMWTTVFLTRLQAAKTCCCGGGCQICLR